MSEWLGTLMKIFRIVFKNNKYLSDVDQEYIVIIRWIQAVVRTKQKEYQEKCRNLCIFGIGLQI